MVNKIIITIIAIIIIAIIIIIVIIKRKQKALIRRTQSKIGDKKHPIVHLKNSL